jgi:pimeloyl-ACP methyl ester carboxylesterase
VGLRGETSIVAELTELRRSELWHGEGAPDGHGRTVVLVSGFGMPSATVKPLGRWLEAGGWTTVVVPTGLNHECGEQAVREVERLVDGAVARSEQPVALIGHSRGGHQARVAAVRQPERVGALVTLGAPWSIGPPPGPGIDAMTRAIRTARRHGLDRFGSIDCRDGPCCELYRQDVRAVPVAPWTAIWSGHDDVVGADATPPSGAMAVDIGTSHIGTVLSVRAWRAIGDALEAWGQRPAAGH